MTQDRPQFLTLTNRQGWLAKLSPLGATVTQLHVPDRSGELRDVVLGFETLRQYREHGAFFGAIVGRVANRIADARFELEGRRYELAANDAPHHLHGGTVGWDKLEWTPRLFEDRAGPGVEFMLRSTHGDEGYPGTVEARVVYRWTHDGELRVEMTATTDATTLVNLAHHSYWNLAGHDSGSIEDHELTLHCSRYTPGASGLVPDGTIADVAGTPFDFREPKPIGRDLARAGGTPVGYDHNWIVDGDSGSLRPVAKLLHPGSGRTMTLLADQPGVQFYSGNFLDGTLHGKGARYDKHAGLCLETQLHPNSINVPEWRDAVVLRPGQTYRHRMLHRFGVDPR